MDYCMQSLITYFTYFSVGILSLEIAYFLLCIVSQFKRLNVVMIVSVLIHLGLLFLVNRFFLSHHGELTGELLGKFERSVIGFIIFSLLGLSIIGSDERDLLVKKKVALKLPFMGLFLGYFIIAGDLKINLFLLGLGLLANLFFLYRTRERFRLYFRSYVFFLLSLVGVLSFEIQTVGVIVGTIFSFLSILYLQQFLNLLLVKTYMRESLL